jgi:hypothetical protein
MSRWWSGRHSVVRRNRLLVRAEVLRVILPPLSLARVRPARHLIRPTLAQPNAKEPGVKYPSSPAGQLVRYQENLYSPEATDQCCQQPPGPRDAPQRHTGDTFWNGYKVHVTETCATADLSVPTP